MALLQNINSFVRWSQEREQYLPIFWKREVIPSWLSFDFNDVPTGTITIPAAGTPTSFIPMKQPYASLEGLDQGMGTPFEVDNLVFADRTDGSAAANFTVLMREVGELRQFMNRPVHIRSLFATSGRTAALMRQPYYFLSQHNLGFQFAKVTGGATTARLSLGGKQFYPWAPEFLRKQQSHNQMRSMIQRWLKFRKSVTPYWLTHDTDIDLAGNGSGEFFAKVGDDGSVEIITITAVSTGRFELEFSEPKTHQTLMNGLISNTAAIGDANFPTILPTPYLLPAGYRLRIFVRDLSGAPNRIFLTLGGRKIYRGFMDKFYDREEPGVVPTPFDDPTQMVPPPLAQEGVATYA